MAWVTILDGDIDPDSPITTSLVTALRDNVAALAAGDSGAPEIVQAAMATGSVGQGQLKTTYQEVSQAVGAGVSTTLYFTPTGGVYILGSTFRSSVARTLATIQLSNRILGLTTSDVSEWALTVNDAGSQGAFTGYGRLYYVNSSPPYDLGFGNIPLFIFLLIDNTTQELESVSVSVDAPWHYNGSTNIVPDHYIDGVPYKSLPEIEFELIAQGKTLVQELRGANRAATLERLKDDPVITVEIGQTMKNADMPQIPHPFNDSPGKTIAVVNPQSDICGDLLLIHKRGESVAELFHNGDIIVGTTNLVRGFDPSIKCFDISWSA